MKKNGNLPRKERRANVNDLKPKANKLLSFITNWRLADKEKTMELSQTIQKLMKSGKFPNTIRAFFKFPEFKELLKTMEGGKLFELTSDEEDLLARIYNLQILIETFHRLVHIDYNKEKIKEPHVHVKVFAKNLLDYLECADLLILQEGPIVQEVHAYLFQSIQHFSIEIKKVISNNPDIFTKELIKLAEEPIFNYFSHIDTTTYSKTLNEKWFKVMVELNIDPKLRNSQTQSTPIGKAVAHKLINQMKCLIEKKRQFYQQNPPYYIPTTLRDKIQLELNDAETDPLTASFCHDRLAHLFEEKKFSLLEAKEIGLLKKIHHIQDEFALFKESLFTLIDEYGSLVPTHFREYLHLLNSYKLTHPNVHQSHLITQLELGFYSVQYDYLMDILTQDPPSYTLPASAIDQIYAALPHILWFLENYYAKKPLASFLHIKKILTNILHTQKPAVKIKEKVSKVFPFLIPQTENSYTEIETHLFHLFQILKELPLPPSSIESELQRERLRNLSQIDLPSHHQTWFVIGEILGFFFTLLSQSDPSLPAHLHSLKTTLSKHTFLQILLS